MYPNQLGYRKVGKVAKFFQKMLNSFSKCPRKIQYFHLQASLFTRTYFSKGSSLLKTLMGVSINWQQMIGEFHEGVIGFVMGTDGVKLDL